MADLNALNNDCIWLVLDKLSEADVINTFLASSGRARDTVKGYYLWRLSVGHAVLVNFADGLLTIDAPNVMHIYQNCPNIAAVFEDSLGAVKYRKNTGVAVAQDLRSFYQLCARGRGSLMNVNMLIIECQIRNSFYLREVFTILLIIPTITILDLDCNLNFAINLQNWQQALVNLNTALTRHVVIFYDRRRTNNVHRDFFNRVNNNDFIIPLFNNLKITFIEK